MSGGGCEISEISYGGEVGCCVGPLVPVAWRVARTNGLLVCETYRGLGQVFYLGRVLLELVQLQRGAAQAVGLSSISRQFATVKCGETS